MDFSLNEDHHELAALTRRILAGERTGRPAGAGAGSEAGAAHQPGPPGAQTHPTGSGAASPPGAPPHRSGFDAATWADLARAGVLSAGLPEALGGSGLGLFAHCAVLAEIGRAVADLPYLESVVLGAGAVARFGTPISGTAGPGRPGVANCC
jgi:alkylation response protein AidB-like acyl-CoA dehydrogenase